MTTTTIPTLSEKHRQDLRLANQIFNLKSLGGGSPHIGVNVMAKHLFEVANASCGSMTFDTTPPANVGVSHLVCGPLTEALTRDACDVTQQCQRNGSTHLEQVGELLARVKKGNSNLSERLLSTLDMDIPSNEAVSMIAEPFSTSEPRDFFREHPGDMRRDLLKNSLMTAAAQTPAQLKRCLDQAHHGLIYVRTRIRDQKHAEVMAPLILDAIVGQFSEKNRRSTRALYDLTVPPEVLRAVLAGEPKVGHFGRHLVLLTDVTTEHDLTPDPTAEPTQSIPLCENFRKALCQAMADRTALKAGQVSRRIISAPYAEGTQLRFVKFLGKCEAHYPGITTAAYPLFASLLYGLLCLLEKYQTESSLYNLTAMADAMARLLVLRMIHVRQCVIEEGTEMALDKLTAKILERLESSPRSSREIVRSINKLRMPECLQALDYLRSKGLIVEEDRKWTLAPDTRVTTTIEINDHPYASHIPADATHEN